MKSGQDISVAAKADTEFARGFRRDGGAFGTLADGRESAQTSEAHAFTASQGSEVRPFDRGDEPRDAASFQFAECQLNRPSCRTAPGRGILDA
jgi:hypothetical protein